MSKYKNSKTGVDVVFILPNLTFYGGAERVIIDLATVLSDRGYNVEIVALKTKISDNVSMAYYGKLLNEKTKFVDLKGIRVRNSIFSLYKYLKKRNPELIVTTLWETNLLLILFKVLLRFSFRLVIREASNIDSAVELYGIKYKIISKLIYLLYPYADIVICPSYGIMNNLRSKFKIEKVKLIHNPIPPYLKEKSLEINNHKWIVNKTCPVVIAGGRLTKVKDFQTLLNSFSMLKEKIDVRLIIMGEGEQKNELMGICEKLGIQDFVDFVGFCSNPFSYFFNSDVFVLSSIHEGMPNMLVQAIACGCPAVSTNCSYGPSEIIDDGVNGYLVSVGDVDRMAISIEKLLNNELDRITVMKTVKKFEIEYIADEYAKIIFKNEILD